MLLRVSIGPLLRIVIRRNVAENESKHGELDRKDDATAPSRLEHSFVSVKCHHDAFIFFFTRHSALRNLGMEHVLVSLALGLGF